jgi:fructoselysine-6-P-deglycase FrlB-like protein
MSTEQAETSVFETEMRSQPHTWAQAAALAGEAALPASGKRVLILGCGTSLFAGQAIAAWRETARQGETDVFAASEAPRNRDYDEVVLISRSGTTSELLLALDRLEHRGTVVSITATSPSPVADAADRLILLPFADESAIPQTRFPTTVIALWRAQLGHDIAGLADRAEAQLASPNLPERLTSAEQFVFLGTGPGAALASEAALKFRETDLAWTEAYPAMELRHGPISLLGERSVVWALGELPDGLADEITETGAALEDSHEDPLVELVRIHGAALALAQHRGLDPDNPPRLNRSVVLK